MACTPSNKQTSEVSIKMPGNSSQSLSNKFSQSVSALASPWDEMCYLVNVTGESLASQKKNSCEIRKGITSKFIPAGGEVKMTVPQGNGYKLQLIGFERASSSDPCPTLNADSDLESLDQTKLKELAVQDFDAAGEQTTVALTAAIPANDLKTHYGLASNCSVAGPATISVSDVSYNFGTKVNGSTASKTFIITNTGGVTASTLVINGLTTPYSFSGGNCLGFLNAGATCSVIVDFAPTASGTFPDAIDISFNDGTAPQTFSRTFTGSSVTPASLSISDGATFDYGVAATGSSTPYTFTVTNSGASTASGITVTGLAAPFSQIGGTCGASLGASANCTIEVQFSPGSTGVHTDTFDISYNDGVAVQTSSRDVHGTGAAPALISISDIGYSYDLKAILSSTNKTFTITNSGGVNATSLNGNAFSSEFSWSGGSYPGTGGTCTASLAAGANCTVVVAFAPTALGTFSDNVSISYHNGVLAGQTATNSISGDSAEPHLWIGITGDGLWTTASNWLGGTVPSTGDIAAFSGQCIGVNCNATINAAINISGLQLKASYTGTLTAGNFTFYVQNFEQSGGTFDASGLSGFNANVSSWTKLYGGSFTSTPQTWATAHFEKTGSPTFNHSMGTFQFNAFASTTQNIRAGGLSFYNVKIWTSGGSPTFDLNTQVISVINDLTVDIAGGRLNNGTINTKNVILNSGSGGTAQVVFTSSTSSVSGTAGALPNVQLANATTFLNANGTTIIRGNFISNGGNIFGSAGSEVVFEPGNGCSNTNLDLTGSNFANLRFTSNGSCFNNIFSISGSAVVSDNLRFSPGAGNGIKINGGTIQVTGNAYVDTPDMRGGTSLVRLVGTSNQIVSGVAVGKFPQLEIASTGGTVDFSGIVGVGGNLTYTSGALNMNTSEVVMYNMGNYAIAGSMSFYKLSFKKSPETTGPLSIVSTIDVTEKLTISDEGSSCYGVNFGTILVRNELSVSCGSAPAGTGVISFANTSLTAKWFHYGYLPVSTLKIASTNGYGVTANTGGAAIYRATNLTIESGSFSILTPTTVNLAVSNTLNLFAATVVNMNSGGLSYGSLVGGGSVNP